MLVTGKTRGPVNQHATDIGYEYFGRETDDTDQTYRGSGHSRRHFRFLIQREVQATQAENRGARKQRVAKQHPRSARYRCHKRKVQM